VFYTNTHTCIYTNEVVINQNPHTSPQPCSYAKDERHHAAWSLPDIGLKLKIPLSHPIPRHSVHGRLHALLQTAVPGRKSGISWVIMGYHGTGRRRPARGRVVHMRGYIYTHAYIIYADPVWNATVCQIVSYCRVRGVVLVLRNQR
jgi:hypothetical protein